MFSGAIDPGAGLSASRPIATIGPIGESCFRIFHSVCLFHFFSCVYV